MTYYEEYYGEFMSQGGVLWRVEIWNKDEDGATHAAARELTFPYDTPLTIEWDTKELEEPLCGAVATLTVVSETDRQFTDYYRTALCATQLRVYRGGYIFWVGTLNTEEYSEPFQTYDGYETSLTFSDLAQGEYVKFQPREQMVSLMDMLVWARADLGLSLTGRDDETSCAAVLDNYAFAGQNTLSQIEYDAQTDPSKAYGGYYDSRNLRFLAANYFDRDETAYRPWQEVLEDVCRAIGARVVQWWGRLTLYTPDGLFLADGTPKEAGGEVYWTGDEQTLEMGKVYNNIKITATPSDDALTLLTGEDDDTTMQGNGGSFSTLGPYYYDNYDTSQAWTNQKLPPNTFNLRTTVTGEVRTLHDTALRPVEIVEGNDGIGERKAIIYHATVGADRTLARTRSIKTDGAISSSPYLTDRFASWRAKGGSRIFTQGKKLFSSRPFFLIGSDLYAGGLSTVAQKFYVGVNVPLLCTCLQNPGYSPTLQEYTNESGSEVVDPSDPISSDNYWADPNGVLRHRELYHAASLNRIPYTIFIRNDKGYVTAYLHSRKDNVTGATYTRPEWVKVAKPSATDPAPDMPAFLIHSGCNKVKDGGQNGTSSLGQDFDDCTCYDDAAAEYSAMLTGGEREVSLMAKMELLDRPPVSGMAELVVYEGVFFSDFNPDTPDPFALYYYPLNDAVSFIEHYQKDEYRTDRGSQKAYREYYKYIYWIVYGLPQVSYICPDTCEAVSPEGKEYSTALDPDRKDSLEITTSLGSDVDGQNLGCCALFMPVLNTLTGVVSYEPMTGFRNKNLTKGKAEDWDALPYVVASQWHSQYDTAKIMLSGESRLPDMGRLLLTEEHYPGKYFLVKGGTLTALTDTFEATYQEVAPTQYVRQRT